MVLAVLVKGDSNLTNQLNLNQSCDILKIIHGILTAVSRPINDKEINASG